MIPFWLAFLLPTLLTFSSVHRRHHALIWLLLLVFFVMFTGLRHEVGGDWGTYLHHYESAQYFSFWEYLSRMDPGYMLLNWVSFQLDGGIYLVNTLSALIFFSCLIIFCRAQPLPFLALTAAIPYMVTVIANGYTRQAIALSLVMLALQSLSAGRLKHYLIYIAIGALFHKSAIILLPLAVFYTQRRLIIRIVGVGGFSVIMGYLFLVDHFEALWVNYVDSQMQSDGGLIRLMMNLVPSIIFFVYYRRIRQEWDDYRIWFIFALGTVMLIPLVGFASTAVDRVALYLIPLQLVVFSRLPMLFSESGGRATVVKAIVGYYALVLFVWLNYASHAKYWLPYQNLITLDLF